jgi:hypothetical protein
LKIAADQFKNKPVKIYVPKIENYSGRSPLCKLTRRMLASARKDKALEDIFKQLKGIEEYSY